MNEIIGKIYTTKSFRNSISILALISYSFSSIVPSYARIIEKEEMEVIVPQEHHVNLSENLEPSQKDPCALNFSSIPPQKREFIADTSLPSPSRVVTTMGIITSEDSEKEAKLKAAEAEIIKNPKQILKILTNYTLGFEDAEVLLYKYAPNLHYELHDKGLIDGSERYPFSIVKTFVKILGFIGIDMFLSPALQELVAKKLLANWVLPAMQKMSEIAGHYVTNKIKDVMEYLIGDPENIGSIIKTIFSNIFSITKVILTDQIKAFFYQYAEQVSQSLASKTLINTAYLIKDTMNTVIKMLYTSEEKRAAASPLSSHTILKFEKLWDSYMNQGKILSQTIEENLLQDSPEAHWIFDQEDLIETNSQIFYKSYFWKITSASFQVGASLCITTGAITGAEWLFGQYALAMPIYNYAMHPLYKWVSQKFYVSWAEKMYKEGKVSEITKELYKIQEKFNPVGALYHLGENSIQKEIKEVSNNIVDKGLNFLQNIIQNVAGIAKNIFKKSDESVLKEYVGAIQRYWRQKALSSSEIAANNILTHIQEMVRYYFNKSKNLASNAWNKVTQKIPSFSGITHKNKGEFFDPMTLQKQINPTEA